MGMGLERNMLLSWQERLKKYKNTKGISRGGKTIVFGYLQHGRRDGGDPKILGTQTKT